MALSALQIVVNSLFVIASAQAAGATADFKSLADGVWDGDVKSAIYCHLGW